MNNNSISSQYYKEIEKKFPSGPILLLCKILDMTPILSSYDWRSYLPFRMGEAPDGIFSHRIGLLSEYFPKLKSYNEVPGGIKEFLFESSTFLGDLTLPMTQGVLFVLVIFLCLLKSLLLPMFESLGKSLASETHGKGWVRNNPEKITKFGEYCFRLLYHSLISVYGLWYFSSKSWWDSANGGTKNLWNDWPNQPIEPGMTWFYLIQAAYNIQALLSLLTLSLEFRVQSSSLVVWSDRVRGDFREMVIHHIVTNSLIFLSSFYRLHRVGSMIYLVHDVSDVPVDLSKLANFMKWRTSTLICFIIMVIVWVITRLGIFPFVIYRSALFETFIMMEYGLHPYFYYAYRFPLYILMGAMIALHFAWFLMFIRMGFHFCFIGKIHDFSEHKKSI